MKKQRRGQATKERLLEAACAVFAERGYRDATHAEICQRANANAAAINYHFTSKEALYRAAFEHLVRRAEEIHPLDGDLPLEAPPGKRLRAFIHGHLSRIFSPEHMEGLHKIIMSERFDPTGLLEGPLARDLAENRKHILKILRELLGPEAPQRDEEWCEMSIVSQCLVPAHGETDEEGPRAPFKLDASSIDSLTEHILTFSLAGVEAIRRRGLANPESQHAGTGACPRETDAQNAEV